MPEEIKHLSLEPVQRAQEDNVKRLEPVQRTQKKKLYKILDPVQHTQERSEKVFL